MKQVHMLISGRVQRVFFRARTRAVAQKLGLVGFVRNLPDGTVEVVAEGNKEKLKKLVDYCKKGPILVKVENIKIEYKGPNNRFNNFEIVY